MSRPAKSLSLRRGAALAILLLTVAVRPAIAQTPPAPGDDRPIFYPPNSLRIGDFRMAVRVRLQQDFRRFSAESRPEGWEPIFRRARVGVQGQFFNDLDYDFDAELRDEAHPLRNAYVNFARYEAAEIRAGRFKVPFGREQLGSIFELDFVERALISTILVPARDTGVMMHGEIADGIVAYRAGVFAHDGDTARFDRRLQDDRVETVRPGDGSWAGRLIIRPWAQSGGPLRRLEIAAAMTATSMEEGVFSAEGRTLSGFRFSPPVPVHGSRTRLGLDGSWLGGPFGFHAEYIRLRDEREGLGGEVDLPAIVAQGWYVSAAWTLTGEPQSQELSPRRPLLGGGIGAVEAAARIESLAFNTESHDIRENGDVILTFGVNWYPSRWGRIMFDVTREHLNDPSRTPVRGRRNFWGAACRLQFVL